MIIDVNMYIHKARLYNDTNRHGISFSVWDQVHS